MTTYEDTVPDITNTLQRRPSLGISWNEREREHPDTICDAIAECIAVKLAQAYQKAFGRILHHNIDKCLLVAGQVTLHIGRGRVTQPMHLILGDRASFALEKEKIPVIDIAMDSARPRFRQHLPRVDPDKHVQYQDDERSWLALLHRLWWTWADEFGSG